MTDGFAAGVRKAAHSLPVTVKIPVPFIARHYAPEPPESERKTWIAAYDKEADGFRFILTEDARRGRFTEECVLTRKGFIGAASRRKASVKTLSAWLFPYGLDDFRAVHPDCGIRIIDELGRAHHRQDPEISSAIYAAAYLERPCLEQMVKGGFAEAVYRDCSGGKLFTSAAVLRPGTDIRGITGLPDYAWREAAGKIRSLNDLLWLRALAGDFDPGSEALRRVLALDLGADRTDFLSVLRQHWNGKPLYTVASLLDYLERIRMKQGLAPEDAVGLLKDYNEACLRLGVEPVVKSASLERDHDVMNRIYLSQTEEERAQLLQASFEQRAKELKGLEYTDGRLSVMVPGTAKDLYDEGRNNHNCVATYAESHASGKTSVLFVRKADRPGESYITLELDRDRHRVRQAYYGHNRRISREDRKFIDTWLEETGSK